MAYRKTIQDIIACEEQEQCLWAEIMPLLPSNQAREILHMWMKKEREEIAEWKKMLNTCPGGYPGGQYPGGYPGGTCPGVYSSQEKPEKTRGGMGLSYKLREAASLDAREMSLYAQLYDQSPTSAMRAMVLMEMNNEVNEMTFLNTLSAVYDNYCPGAYQVKEEKKEDNNK